jgi:hypothetical protein
MTMMSNPIHPRARKALNATDYLQGMTPRQQKVMHRINSDNAEWNKREWRTGLPFEDANLYRQMVFDEGKSALDIVTVRSRAVTEAEKVLAQQLATRVDRIMVDGDAMVTTATALPPGRIRFSAAVEHRLQIHNRRMPNARPFARRRIEHSPRTPLKVGFILDISASMSHVAALGASAAWVVSEAVARVNGEVANVAFSRGIYPLQAPGERTQRVMEFTTVGGYHYFDRALLMTDAALNLIDSDGARVLLVFSDAQYGPSNSQGFATLDEAVQNGVAVVFITDESLPSEVPSRAIELVIDGTTTIDQLVPRLGDAIVAAVAKAKEPAAA